MPNFIRFVHSFYIIISLSWREYDAYKTFMKTWIILLRGINVGGNNIIKMGDLRALLTKAGYSNVRTYIQSGNIAFEHGDIEPEEICEHVTQCIYDSHGFAPRTMAMSYDSVVNIIASNPYKDAEATPKALHVFFLKSPAIDAEIEALEALKTENERFAITDEAVYLHLPDGVWKSKLSSKLEKHLGVPATARNWRSVNKILDLANKKKSNQ